MSITLGWFSLPVSNHGSLVWDLRTKKCKKPELGDNPSITTSKMNMSPKKVPFQNEFSWDIREFFWGNDCIKTSQTHLGLSTERAAVPPAAAVVAPWQRLPPRWQIQPSGRRPVASATQGSEAPGEKNTWKKRGRRTEIVFVDFLPFFWGVEIYDNTQVFCKGASMVETV